MEEITSAFKPWFEALRKNPHMGLAILLFGIGAFFLLSTQFSAVAGAMFGAGASLTGAWITELNNRRSNSEEKSQREVNAKKYLTPELKRTIDRVLHIHRRSIANFSAASAGHDAKPTDLQADFVPFMPTLYPSSPQFRDLSGEDAVALVVYYDSLHAIDKIVADWWGREGESSVNIFNGILHAVHKSLVLAQECMRKFEIDSRFPPEYEAWGSLSSRIETSLSNERCLRDAHQARYEAKK
jgi:hypothetical protein